MLKIDESQILYFLVLIHILSCENYRSSSHFSSTRFMLKIDISRKKFTMRETKCVCVRERER